jgi:hypothetical protein
MGSKGQKQKTVEKKPPKEADLARSAIKDRGGHCQSCPLKKRFIVKRPPRLLGGLMTHKNLPVKVVCDVSPDTERKPFQGTSGVKPEENHTFCTSFRRFMARNK